MNRERRRTLSLHLLLLLFLVPSGLFPAVRAQVTPDRAIEVISHDLVPAITVTNAIRLVEQGLKGPFMLRVSTIAPHTPILAPEPFDTMYDPKQVPFDPPTDEELARSPATSARCSAAARAAPT